MSKKPLPIKTDEAVKNLLFECYRVLKPGGIIRIITPNLDYLYELYINNENILDLWRDRFNPLLFYREFCETDIHQLFLQNIATQLSELSIDLSSPQKISDDDFQRIVAQFPYPEFLKYISDQCNFNPELPANHINWLTYKKINSMFIGASFINIWKSAYAQTKRL